MNVVPRPSGDYTRKRRSCSATDWSACLVAAAPCTARSHTDCCSSFPPASFILKLPIDTARLLTISPFFDQQMLGMRWPAVRHPDPSSGYLMKTLKYDSRTTCPGSQLFENRSELPHWHYSMPNRGKGKSRNRRMLSAVRCGEKMPAIGGPNSSRMGKLVQCSPSFPIRLCTVLLTRLNTPLCQLLNDRRIHGPRPAADAAASNTVSFHERTTMSREPV